MAGGVRLALISIALFVVGLLVVPVAGAGDLSTADEAAARGLDESLSSPSRQSQASRAAVYADLDGAVAAKGSAQAIVSLDLPITPEGRLSQPARRAQRATIASTQAEFSASLGAGASVGHRYRSFAGVVVRIRSARGVDSLRALDDRVRAVRVDAFGKLHGAPENKLMGVHHSWVEGFSGSGGAIAIVDTGVDATLDEFAGPEGSRVIAEACFSHECPNGEEEMKGPGAAAEPDGGWHGTAVMGEIAGSDGVAPTADIVAVRHAFTANCWGQACAAFYDSDALRGIEWVLDVHDTYGITTLNLSFAWDESSSDAECLDALGRETIQSLVSEGVVVVAASGNDGSKNAMGAPACMPEVVSVGATASDALEGMQAAGYSNSASFLDFIGPVPDQLAGTSFAAPQVAGVFHLLMTAFPDAPASDVWQALSDTGYYVTDVNDVATPFPQLGAAYESLDRIYDYCVDDPSNGIVCEPPPPADEICPPGENHVNAYDFPVDDNGVRTVLGTPCADVIQGSNDRDWIYAFGGDDHIDGLDGDDLLYGMAGNDRVEGGAGRDVVDGGDGDDKLFGDAGASPEPGDDHVYGGGGDDEIHGGDTHELADGWSDDDLIYGGSGDDFIEGNAGDDYIVGGSGADSMWGWRGDDYMYGKSGNDLIFANGGHDRVWAGSADDYVNLTHDESSVLLMVGDIDVAYGGSGTDTAVRHLYDATPEFENVLGP